MTIRTWLVPAAAAALLAACSSQKATDQASTESTSALAPPVAPASAPACLNQATIANTCVPKTLGGWTGFVCPVKVTRTAEGITVNPHHLRVPMPPAKVRIVWIMAPGSTDTFTTTEGPTFGTSSEFDMYTPTADDDGDVAATAGTRFRVRFKNTVATPPAGTYYTMIMHTPSGTATCDPVIHNQGG